MTDNPVCSTSGRSGPARFNGGATTGSLAVGRKLQPKRFVRQQIPDHVLLNEALNSAIAVLPANYSFEVHKTVWRLKQAKAKRVAIQFPEGLLMYSCVIADILESFADVEHCFILGDVTYGACCIDDFSAAALGADFLVHYGHSCLVPVDVTKVPCMYIFVDIKIDTDHLIESIRFNFSPGSNLILAGTIQFASSIQLAKQQLASDFPSLVIPQSKPLSPGEVLGCTAPVIAQSADALVFVADGRFHLEAIMIANPDIPAFRYDPYGRVLTEEHYDHMGMRQARRKAIETARKAKQFGLILGTLGRQGNPRILDHLQGIMMQKDMNFTVVLLSEVAPWKLDMMSNVDAWIQIACPRLSIDWGEGFHKPTLTPYEAMIALDQVPGWWQVEVDSKENYPMDYYAKDGGIWNSTWQQKNVRPRVKA
ncbi:hypothetical protein WJX77_005684 [Trebouxia sp. C0004]